MEIINKRKDWKVEKLGDFAIHEKGKKPKRQQYYFDDIFRYPYINIEAFEKGIFRSYTDGEKCNFCTSKDFLMVWDGSRSGLVGKGVDGALGSTLVRINFPKIENNFAFYFLQSKFQQINTRAKGTGTPHVDPRLLWNYDFPIAPLPEQRAIVAKIEQLFSDLDHGIEQLKKAQAQLKIYRQAVLKKAFEGELTKEWRAKQKGLPTAEVLLEQIKEERQAYYEQQLDDWTLAVQTWEKEGKVGKKPGKPRKMKEVEPINNETLNDEINFPYELSRLGIFIDKIEAGKSFRCEERPPTVNEVGVAKVSAVTWGTYDEQETKTCTDITKVNPNYYINKGDFLLSRANTIALVGTCVIVHNTRLNIMLSDKTLRIKYLYGNPYFYLYYLRSRYGRLEIESKSTGNQESMRNIGQNRISNIIIPLYPHKEQHQIVQEIESRLSVCDQVEKSIQESLGKAASLRQSILKKAFEGKLLTTAELDACRQEKDWEPASVLLERIKEEKEQAVLLAKKVKKKIKSK